jgi:hypothetical protein
MLCPFISPFVGGPAANTDIDNEGAELGEILGQRGKGLSE